MKIERRAPRIGDFITINNTGGFVWVKGKYLLSSGSDSIPLNSRLKIISFPLKSFGEEGDCDVELSDCVTDRIFRYRLSSINKNYDRWDGVYESYWNFYEESTELFPIY